MYSFVTILLEVYNKLRIKVHMKSTYSHCKLIDVEKRCVEAEQQSNYEESNHEVFTHLKFTVQTCMQFCMTNAGSIASTELLLNSVKF